MVTHTFRALRHPNYRLFFAGQVVSLAGTWMQQVAMSWLAYRLTNSSYMLGLIAFLSLIPLLPLAPIGGLLADRWNKRTILLFTQGFSLVHALVLAGLTLSGAMQSWHLIALALAIGFVNAIDIPVRQAFVVLMVEDRADMPNAIALNSASLNAARLAGPALGGLVIGFFGEGICFLLNAASYLAVMASLLLMRVPHTSVSHAAPLAAIRQGFAYAWGHVRIRQCMLLVATFSFFIVPYQVTVPYFAKTVYGGAAQTYGFLMSANGAGALAGVLFLASRKHVKGLEMAIGLAAMGAAFSLGVFALAQQFWLGVLSIFTLGFCLFFLLSSCNTVVQSQVKDDMRGRVMSVYSMALAGVAPVGSLLQGWMAETLDPHTALLVGAGMGLLAGGFFFRASRRPCPSGAAPH